MFREASRPKCILETHSLGYVSLPPVQMHMLWEEHTANHLSIDNSVNLTQGWSEFVMGSIKGRKKLQGLRWLIWEMSMRRLGRGFGTGLHTWRRTENNQTKPLILHNCATSCPCSPQHFRNGSHLYLSLGAKSLIVYSILHFLEDKSPLIELACSEWY